MSAMDGVRKGVEEAKKGVEGAKKAVEDAQDKVEIAQNIAMEWMKERLRRGDEALREGPKVAVLVKADAPENVFDALRNICQDGSFEEALVKYQNVPCHLLVLQPPLRVLTKGIARLAAASTALGVGDESPGSPSLPSSPAAWSNVEQQHVRVHHVISQVNHLCNQLEESARVSPSSPWLWPVHVDVVSEAVMVRAEALGGRSRWQVEESLKKGVWMNQLQKVLGRLGILPPKKKMIDLIRDQYGQGVASLVDFSHFYIQQLWILIVLCLVGVAMGIETASENELGTMQTQRTRVLRLASHIVAFVWGIGTTLAAWRHHRIRKAWRLERKKEQNKEELLIIQDPRGTKDRRRRPNESASIRWAKLLFLGGPAGVALTLVVFGSQIAVTQLVLHIIWIWGDCVNLYKEVDGCDATHLHGFWGWLAEVLCDILLALLYEIFFGLSGMLAEWMARVRHFRHEKDHRFLVMALKISLAAFERLGFLGVLAFVFVPQWRKPAHDGAELGDLANEISLCSEFFLGQSDFRCLQQRLPVQLRRRVFEKLTKGPFLVAPFVGILLKVIVPWVAGHLAFLTTMHLQMRRKWCLCGYLSRILALIFSYSGKVGGLAYLRDGWPFSDVEEVAQPQQQQPQKLAPDVNQVLKPARTGVGGIRSIPDNTKSKDSLRYALWQSVRKPFEAESEIMDVILSFLFVLYFAPIRPLGVLFTLAAKILHSKMSLVNLLYVRARPLPEDDLGDSRTRVMLMFFIVFGSMSWFLGLNLLTYNDELWTWSDFSCYSLTGFILCWGNLATILALVLNEVRRLKKKDFAEKLDEFKEATADLWTVLQVKAGHQDPPPPGLARPADPPPPGIVVL
mmetsp:Transcript_10980/g.23087  ORF Transcript_10980/g.23087 Transcript_10980/m.23087 type:complete len:851 (-) Transcript_10980:28-2580(-)